MKRKFIDELIQWNNSNTNKPVLLTGAKGVGKTYLAYDFAKAFFERIFYINFERDLKASEQLQNKDSNQISELFIRQFQINDDFNASKGIVILDEISYCNEYMNIIKLLSQTKLFSKIIAISSNPLSSIHKEETLHITVYPMEFDEFLRATGNEWYIEVIRHHFDTNKKIPDIVHKELLALHQLYLQIGGMPSIINEYLNMSSIINVAELHNLFLGFYHDYILKDNSDKEALKMNQVLDSIPLQLNKENKKFQYKLIRKGTTHAMYKDAIQQLSDRNYVIRCNKVTTEQLQISDYQQFHEEISNPDHNTIFKLYLSDTGLLSTRMVEEKDNNIDDTSINEAELGLNHESNHMSQLALLENYVAQSLQSNGYYFAFWESDSMAKIDFIIHKEDELIPIEIHDSDNTRSKSISVFKQKCNFPYAIKVSSKNFEYSNQIKYVPYYAVFCI